MRLLKAAEVTTLFGMGIVGNKVADSTEIATEWLVVITTVGLVLSIAITYQMREDTETAPRRRRSSKGHALQTLLWSVPIGVSLVLLARTTTQGILYTIAGIPAPFDGLTAWDRWIVVSWLPDPIAWSVFDFEVVTTLWAGLFLGLVWYFADGYTSSATGAGFGITIPIATILRDPGVHDPVSTVFGGFFVYGAMVLLVAALTVLYTRRAKLAGANRQRRKSALKGSIG